MHPLQIPLWIWAAAVAALAGHPAASGQFFAGWLTEYSLLVDNLFLFVLLISRSAVPRELRSRVLLLGVALALLLRGIFIAPGASPLHRFGWLLYCSGRSCSIQGRSCSIQRSGWPSAAADPAKRRYLA